jgi:hypothetical protein
VLDLRFCCWPIGFPQFNFLSCRLNCYCLVFNFLLLPKPFIPVLVRAWGTSLVDLDLGPKDTEHRARSPAPLGSSHISWSCRNSLEVSPIGGRSPFSFCASIFSAAKFDFWLHLFCRRNSYPRQGFCFCVDSRSAHQLILLSWPGSRWECFFFFSSKFRSSFLLSDFCHCQKFPG